MNLDMLPSWELRNGNVDGKMKPKQVTRRERLLSFKSVPVGIELWHSRTEANVEVFVTKPFIAQKPAMPYVP